MGGKAGYAGEGVAAGCRGRVGDIPQAAIHPQDDLPPDDRHRMDDHRRLHREGILFPPEEDTVYPLSAHRGHQRTMLCTLDR